MHIDRVFLRLKDPILVNLAKLSRESKENYPAAGKNKRRQKSHFIPSRPNRFICGAVEDVYGRSGEKIALADEKT